MYGAENKRGNVTLAVKAFSLCYRTKRKKKSQSVARGAKKLTISNLNVQKASCWRLRVRLVVIGTSFYRHLGSSNYLHERWEWIEMEFRNFRFCCISHISCMEIGSSKQCLSQWEFFENLIFGLVSLRGLAYFGTLVYVLCNFQLYVEFYLIFSLCFLVFTNNW